MSQTEGVEEGPKGFGGWLILPMIGLVLSPFRMAVQFFTDLWPVFKPDVWRQLNDASLPGHQPMLPTMIIVESVVNVAMLVFTLALVWYFFTKSRHTPRLYIVWLVLLVVIQVVDSALVSSLGVPIDKDSMRDLIRSVITSAIWIPYFLVSKRVKNTFVEPRSDLAHHF